MALIKSHSASTLLKDALVLDLGDLGRLAARLQASMEVKARKTITDAHAEAARIIDDARTKGFDEGRIQGVEQGLAEGRKAGRAEALQLAGAQIKQLEDKWLAALKESETDRVTLQREGPQRVLELALRLAEKLVHRIVETDAGVVVDQVATALGHVLKEMDVTVRVNPTDRPAIEEAMPRLVAEFSHLKHLEVVDDAEITSGGCIIVYGNGQVDSTLDTQLRRVAELLVPPKA